MTTQLPPWLISGDRDGDTHAHSLLLSGCCLDGLGNQPSRSFCFYSTSILLCWMCCYLCAISLWRCGIDPSSDWKTNRKPSLSVAWLFAAVWIIQNQHQHTCTNTCIVMQKKFTFTLLFLKELERHRNGLASRHVLLSSQIGYIWRALNNFIRYNPKGFLKDLENCSKTRPWCLNWISVSHFIRKNCNRDNPTRAGWTRRALAAVAAASHWSSAAAASSYWSSAAGRLLWLVATAAERGQRRQRRSA